MAAEELWLRRLHRTAGARPPGPTRAPELGWSLDSKFFMLLFLSLWKVDLLGCFRSLSRCVTQARLSWGPNVLLKKCHTDVMVTSNTSCPGPEAHCPTHLSNHHPVVHIGLDKRWTTGGRFFVSILCLRIRIRRVGSLWTRVWRINLVSNHRDVRPTVVGVCSSRSGHLWR